MDAKVTQPLSLPLHMTIRLRVHVRLPLSLPPPLSSLRPQEDPSLRFYDLMLTLARTLSPNLSNLWL